MYILRVLFYNIRFSCYQFNQIFIWLLLRARFFFIFLPFFLSRSSCWCFIVILYFNFNARLCHIYFSLCWSISFQSYRTWLQQCSYIYLLLMFLFLWIRRRMIWNFIMFLVLFLCFLTIKFHCIWFPMRIWFMFLMRNYTWNCKK